MLYYRILFFLLSLIWTSPLFAYNFKCDRRAINCLVADKSLTVGDYAGFFDQAGRLVAVGQIIGIKDSYREVEISETFNRITPDLRVKLIAKEDHERLQERFQVPRRMFPKALGLAVAAAKWRVLNGFNGQEYNLFFSGRLSNHFSVVLRSMYAVVSGTATERKYDGAVYFSAERDTTIQGLGLTSGIAYEALPNSIISLRGELGLGLMSINASVGENSSLQAVKLDEHIQDGVNMLVRASGSALFNVTHDWHLELMLTENYIFRSHLTSVGLGVIKDL